MADYSTVAVVKEYLGIPTLTTSEDAGITAALSAAEDRIDKYCGRTFVVPSEATARSVAAWSDTVVILPAELAQLADLAVATDTTDNGTFDTDLTSADFYAGPGDQAPFTELRRVAGSWPRPRSGRAAVEITGWFGYAMAVPAPVTQAATMLAARLYQRRSSPLGFQTGASPEFGAVRISRIDPDVAALLTGYRKIAVA
jgi:hypothetical protein